MNLPGFMGATVSMPQWRRAWAAYLGLVTMVDHCSGQVIAALRRRGLWDEALVIFTTDHGEMLGSHRMFQKMCMYEEALRVPFFVKAPGGRPAGLAQRRGQLTTHLDLPATVCEYAGIDWPADGDGTSLKQTIEQPHSPGREFVFSQFSGNAGRGMFQRAVVTATHKYIHNHGDWPELYDLVNDPLEQRNLAGGEASAVIEQSLRAALKQWMGEVGDFVKME
jgi:arylsulfatase A-like enzyme